MITSLRPLLLCASVSLVLFSGCATERPAVQSHPDATVAFGNYKSFLLLHPSGLNAMGNPAATPGLIRQVRQETESAFLAKGLVKSPDLYADLLIQVHGGVADKVDVQDWGLAYGHIGRGLARQEISPYKEGTLFIDVFDRRTCDLIWRGSITTQLTAVPEPEQVKSAVDAIVARYPN